LSLLPREWLRRNVNEALLQHHRACVPVCALVIHTPMLTHLDLHLVHTPMLTHLVHTPMLTHLDLLCFLWRPPPTQSLAKHSGCYFLNITASSIMSKWLGDANRLVRAIFSLASKLQPCIIFIGVCVWGGGGGGRCGCAFSYG